MTQRYYIKHHCDGDSKKKDIATMIRMLRKNRLINSFHPMKITNDVEKQQADK
jgi:hypothetical protein